MEIVTNKHFLYPSGLYASKKPTLVTTILGSCVAVCLYDSLNKFGGINHYMLSYWDGTGMPTPKWGDHAIRKLLENMLGMGAEKKYMQAKIFGGSCRRGSSDVFNIGSNNILVAETCLAKLQIPIVARHTGGSIPRKLIYHTNTGSVDVYNLLSTTTDPE
ncbi:chemotaxis protein CheD [Flammeovirgaceae bacterium 311]|nr:chemotaxis protein CheD [Flammeovirgaceae bacterium 311]